MLLLGMVGLLGSSCLQLLAPPLVSAALMAAERGAKAAQARQRGSTTGLGHSEATNGCIHFWEIGLLTQTHYVKMKFTVQAK